MEWGSVNMTTCRVHSPVQFYGRPRSRDRRKISNLLACDESCISSLTPGDTM
jgi:hypothetical protein